MRGRPAPKRVNFLRLATVATSLTLYLFASPLAAQDIPDGVGVADRVRPEFRPIGGRLGSFFLYPTLESRLEYDDNIFSQNGAAESDLVAKVRAEARLESIWSRHKLATGAYYSRSEFFKNGSESNNEYGGYIDGRGDLDRSAGIWSKVSINHLSEDRNSIASETASRQPIGYDQLVADLGVKKQFGRFHFVAVGGYRDFNFQDGRTRGGALLDQDFRDVRITSAAFTASYKGGGMFSAFLRGSTDRRRYPFGPEDSDFDPATRFDRDSDGTRFEGGVAIELREILYGNIRAGYIKQNYKDIRLRQISGFAFGADLLWNPTRITSIRLSADRSVDSVSSTRTAGNLRSQFSLTASYELRKNIILTTTAGYAGIKPIGPSAKSREFEIGLGARYQLNRRYSIDAGLVHQSRRSDDSSLRYSSNRAILQLRLQL